MIRQQRHDIGSLSEHSVLRQCGSNTCILLEGLVLHVLHERLRHWPWCLVGCRLCLGSLQHVKYMSYRPEECGMGSVLRVCTVAKSSHRKASPRQQIPSNAKASPIHFSCWTPKNWLFILLWDPFLHMSCRNHSPAGQLLLAVGEEQSQLEQVVEAVPHSACKWGNSAAFPTMTCIPVCGQPPIALQRQEWPHKGTESLRKQASVHTPCLSCGVCLLQSQCQVLRGLSQ